MASERSEPPSTSSRTSTMTADKAMSSVCISRITRALTTESPASIIVANWREKICSDFAFGFVVLATAYTGAVNWTQP